MLSDIDVVKLSVFQDLLIGDTHSDTMWSLCTCMIEYSQQFQCVHVREVKFLSEISIKLFHCRGISILL